MKLKNCNIGTAVQSKTTGLTGVIFDVWYDEGGNDVEVHFNSYADDGVKIVKDRVKPETLRKVKSVNEMWHKERVCIVVKNSCVGVRSAVSYLNKLGYNKITLSDWCGAAVVYVEDYGEIQCSWCIDWHYSHYAHLYRDITNDMVVYANFNCLDLNLNEVEE